MIAVVDGPEKAGKSTFVRALAAELSRRGVNVSVRKWTGRAKPDDSEYLAPLAEDCLTAGLISVWDRSWASEHVYGGLLGQDRRLAGDPWLGEWLYGRAVSACGAAFHLTANPSELASRRDESDLPVDPAEEARWFQRYADDYGWVTLSTGYSPVGLGDAVWRAADILMKHPLPPAYQPPYYAGPANPAAVFVGEAWLGYPGGPGTWLPFSDKWSTDFARALGRHAVKCGWTVCHKVPPQKLRGARVVMSCGDKARMWVSNYVATSRSGVAHVALPSPRSSMKSPGVKRVLDSLSRWMEEGGDFEFVKRSADSAGMLWSGT